MSLIDDMVTREREAMRGTPRIDYERMNRLRPKQKAALTRARRKAEAARDQLHGARIPTDTLQQEYKDACEALALVIKNTVKEWNECGAWPDDWRLWEVALEDVLPYGTPVNIARL